MIKLIASIRDVRHVIAKTILWLLGLFMIISQNYGFMLKGLLLTEKEVEFEAVTYTVISSFGLLFIIGGIYLNKFLDKFINKK